MWSAGNGTSSSNAPSVPGAWVSNRIMEIDNFYLTIDLDQAAAFLRKYDVRYIIVGQQERGHYPGPGLDKFDQANGSSVA